MGKHYYYLLGSLIFYVFKTFLSSFILSIRIYLNSINFKILIIDNDKNDWVTKWMNEWMNEWMKGERNEWTEMNEQKGIKIRQKAKLTNVNSTDPSDSNGWNSKINSMRVNS